MEVTDNRIGYNGGIYRAVAKGDDCLFYKPNEDSIVIGINTKEAAQILVYTSSMPQKPVDVKEGLTYLCLKNPEPEKDNKLSDSPEIKLRKIAIGRAAVGINKMFFDNLTVDSNNLQIGGYGSWVGDIALPKPGGGYFSIYGFKGRFDLDLTKYKCYKLKELDFNSIKIGKMGNSFKGGSNIGVYIYGLDNVIEFGGLEPDVNYVDITYCSDETILTILRGIDGHSGPGGYVNVSITLRTGQEITDEMRRIASQNSIVLN